MIIKPVDIA